jgi:hypothetical protein
MPQPGTLPGKAVVVRGGENTVTLDALVSAFENHHDRCEARGEPLVYWLSVNSLPDADTFVDDLARIARRPNDRMRVTTVEAIRSAGFTIEPTPNSETAHCDVWFADTDVEVPPPAALERLSEAFSEPVPNPGGIKYR